MSKVKPDTSIADSRCESVHCKVKIEVHVADRVLGPMEANMLKYFIVHNRDNGTHEVSIVKS